MADVNSKDKWIGSHPKGCDLCKNDFKDDDAFIDGKTIYGPWAFMCEDCHPKFGCGLGTGRGQKYQ